MWTLAVSDGHFGRLLEQGGRIYTVIAYDVGSQQPADYESRGLHAPPPGYQLHKFRGLDLLVREGQTDLPRDVMSICDDLLAIHHTDASTDVIPLILKARLLHRSGMHDEAIDAYRRALHMVPPIHRDYFDHATAWIAGHAPTGTPNATPG